MIWVGGPTGHRAGAAKGEATRATQTCRGLQGQRSDPIDSLSVHAGKNQRTESEQGRRARKDGDGPPARLHMAGAWLLPRYVPAYARACSVSSPKLSPQLSRSLRAAPKDAQTPVIVAQHRTQPVCRLSPLLFLEPDQEVCLRKGPGSYR